MYHHKMLSTRVPVRAFAASMLLVLLFLVASCLSPGSVTYAAADTLLPGVDPGMNTAGWWTDGLAQVDRVRLTKDDILAWNAKVREKNLTRDLLEWKPTEAQALAKELKGNITWLAKQELYCPDGRKVDRRFLDPLLDYMDIPGIPPQTGDRFALLTSQADLRVLPTTQGLFDGAFDYFIDNLQASNLEPGDACLVQHQTRDGKWTCVTTTYASGWIETRFLAFCTREEFAAWRATPPDRVVTAAKTDIFSDPSAQHRAGFLRMGTWVRQPPQGDGTSANPGMPGWTALVMPARDEAGHLYGQTVWALGGDLADQALPATTRTVFRQAFKLLNAPYGWGGSFGEQDCSQFLQEIYSTLGLVLPRNSAAQAKSGRSLKGFGPETKPEEKLKLLAESGVPGFTLLRLPGHIMLYLGCRDGKVWAIHSTWAYREPWQGGDRIRLINRVTVSSLDLGTGSTKGSHLSRLTTAALLTHEDQL